MFIPSNFLLQREDSLRESDRLFSDLLVTVVEQHQHNADHYLGRELDLNLERQLSLRMEGCQRLTSEKLLYF